MRAVVFDLDGTLVDSVPDIHAATAAMLTGIGRGPLDLRTVQGFVGNGVVRLVERCLDATGGRGPMDEALAAFRAHYGAAPARLTRPCPGAVACLEALDAQGFALGLCTNKPEAPTRALLAALGLDRHFRAVVCGDTLPVMKPDPAPLLAALDRLCATPEAAIFVGDSETDAATAEAAGVPFALFTEGYRKSPVEALRPAFAFDRFDALTGALMGGAPAFGTGRPAAGLS